MNSPSNRPGTLSINEACVRTSICMMSNIVETVCERESDLDLMRLANFMDLYRTYLEHTIAPDAQSDELATLISKPCSSVLEPCLGTTECVSFEQFISDSRLLELAAAAATRATGMMVAAPAPLKLSANC